MQATTTTLPPIKYLLGQNGYDSKQIFVEHYIKDTTGVPVDYISAHSHTSRPSLSPAPSPLSTTPPITPMSQNVKQESLSPVSGSFRLPQPHLPSLTSPASQQPSNGTNAAAHFKTMTTSLHTKPPMSLTAISTKNFPHRSNIFSLLSPPESPDINHHQNSPPTFDVYAVAPGPVARQQEQPRYAAPHTQYNTYPAYTSAIKPPAIYSPSAAMNVGASRQPSSLVASQTQGPAASPYHQYQQHQPASNHHHPYAPQPIHQQQQPRYSHPLQPTPISPYDRRSGTTTHALPRLDMSNPMISGAAGLKRIGSPKSLDDQSSPASSSSSSNTNRYQCPYCSKRFSRPSSLRIHTYSHTGEKPFVCTEPGCGRKFSVQSNMRRHLRVHRLGRPVKKVRYDGEVEGVKVMNTNSGLRTC